MKLESKLAKAIFCNASLVDSLFMAENTGESLDLKQAIRLPMYRRAIKCLTLQSLAEMRRLAIKPAINSQYRTICTTRDKESHERLFGGDIFQRLKDINKTVKDGLGSSRPAQKRYQAKTPF